MRGRGKRDVILRRGECVLIDLSVGTRGGELYILLLNLKMIVHIEHRESKGGREEDRIWEEERGGGDGRNTQERTAERETNENDFD